MAEYIGIDVSLEEVWLCVMDEAGDIVREDKVVSDPDAIRDWLLAHAPRAIKIGIETGPDVDLALACAQGPRSAGDLLSMPGTPGECCRCSRARTIEMTPAVSPGSCVRVGTRRCASKV